MMADCIIAPEKGDTRICGKAGSWHRFFTHDPTDARIWKDRFSLFPHFLDFMIETEDGHSIPCGLVCVLSMSGRLGRMASEHSRNLPHLPPKMQISGVRGDILEMLFELYYTSEIKIDLSNFQDIYEVSLQNQIGIGIDACREYVDEMLSPETAQMLLDICEKYDAQKAKFVAEYIEDNEKGEKMRQLSIKRRNSGFGRRGCRKDPKPTNSQEPKRTNGQNPEGTEGPTKSFNELYAEREARQAARQARQAVRLAQEKAYAIENLAPWEDPPVETAP